MLTDRPFMQIPTKVNVVKQIASSLITPEVDIDFIKGI